MTHRFYVPVDLHNKEIIVSGNEAHHIIHVMRLSVGDSVCLFNGMGDECKGKIAEIVNNKIRVETAAIAVSSMLMYAYAK